MAQLLIAAGAPAKRITAAGTPVADNATAQGRARNRRADITVSD